jgi:hypothetical protein
MVQMCGENTYEQGEWEERREEVRDGWMSPTTLG